MSATDLSNVAANFAAVSPADPPPMTIISYSLFATEDRAVLCPRRHGHFIRAECLGDNSTMKAEESCIEENNMTISGSSKAFVKQTETYRKTMADIVVHASYHTGRGNIH